MSSFAQFDDDFGSGHPTPSPLGPDHDIFDDVIQSKAKEAMQQAWASKDPLGFSWEHKTESEKHVARLEAQLARVVKGDSVLEGKRRKEEAEEQRKRKEEKRNKKSSEAQGSLQVDEWGMALNYHEDELDAPRGAQKLKGKAGRGLRSKFEEFHDDDRDGHVVDVREDGEADEEPMLGWDLRSGEKEWKAYLKAERKGDEDEDEDEEGEEDDQMDGGYANGDDDEEEGDDNEEEGDDNEEEEKEATRGAFEEVE